MSSFGPRASRPAHEAGLEARGPEDVKTLTMQTAIAKPKHLVLLTACIMLATIMQALDTTIANVALPYMQGSLSATRRPDQLGADLLYRRRRHRHAASPASSRRGSAASGCS